MGCQLSSDHGELQRMDTGSMLALPEKFRSSATRIHQEEAVDSLSVRPPSPCSTRDFFVSSSRPDSPSPSTDQATLFEDHAFPADLSSLSSTPSGDWQDIVWLRPHQLCTEPRLFIDGVSRGDVKQGVLGDCWLLSACAAVATHQALLERVIDPAQFLSGRGYCGAVVLRFWRFGDWIEVCIDDRLPTREGKLLFASCTHSDEFWLPLLEKAFAKIHGTYSALEGGHAGAALAYLTGGIAERLAVKHCSFEQLDTIFKHGAFVTCAGNDETIQTAGIVHGHAYTLTGVTTLSLTAGGTVSLVRLRNPWADGVEWRGAWSDRSREWDTVVQADRDRCCVQTQDDGEFWIKFDDFQASFHEITVATLGPDFDQDGASDSHRQYEIAHGCWAGHSAGGSRNDLEKFQENPQYLLRLEGAADNEPSSVLIGLMQLPNNNAALLPIAFFLYKTESGTEKLRAEYFLCVQEDANSGPFTDSWEVLARALLRPGDYVIVPATFQPHCPAHFLLRVFALRPFHLQHLEPTDTTHL